MPSSDDEKSSASQYLERISNGQRPRSATPLGEKGYVAHMPDGAVITLRLPGESSPKTNPTSATIEINDRKIREVNNGRVLKLIFPKNAQ
jgi:hypothetical protein